MVKDQRRETRARVMVARLGVGSFVQDMFYGGALVLAVTLSQLVRGREEQPF